MQRVIEYVGEMLPDGHLSVPDEVRQTLTAVAYTQLQVTIRLLQPEEEQIQAAWTAWRQLGQDATPGWSGGCCRLPRSLSVRQSALANYGSDFR